jgi:hypothetical protein
MASERRDLFTFSDLTERGRTFRVRVSVPSVTYEIYAILDSDRDWLGMRAASSYDVPSLCSLNDRYFGSAEQFPYRESQDWIRKPT